MKENKDSFCICKRCGSDIGYKKEIDENVSFYMCLSCGFCSNSLLKRGSEFYKEQMELLPELYQALAFEDDSGLIWLPNTVTNSEKGMVFANGSDIYSWGWTSAKFKNKKLDLENMKHFDKENYIDALEFIGIFS